MSLKAFTEYEEKAIAVLKDRKNRNMIQAYGPADIDRMMMLLVQIDGISSIEKPKMGRPPKA